jgi:hypothetical protein
MNDSLWLNEPDVLYKNNNWMDIFPNSSMTKNQQRNCMTRFVFFSILCILFYKNPFETLLLLFVISVYILTSVKTNKIVNNIKKVSNKVKKTKKPVRINTTKENLFKDNKFYREKIDVKNNINYDKGIKYIYSLNVPAKAKFFDNQG